MSFRSVQLGAAEDVGHVLVQPFHLIAHRVGKLVGLLLDKLRSLLALGEDPWRGADGELVARRSHCGSGWGASR